MSLLKAFEDMTGEPLAGTVTSKDKREQAAIKAAPAGRETQSRLLSAVDSIIAETAAPAAQTPQPAPDPLARPQAIPADKESRRLEYGAGEFAEDAGRKATGALVGGTLSMPAGAEAGIKGAIRRGITGESQPVAAGALLQKASEWLMDATGFMSYAEQAENREKAAVAFDRLVSGVKIPGAEGLAEYGSRVQRDIESGISEAGKQRLEGATPRGNILKGEFSFGDDPTVSGYLLQAAGVLGSLAPTVMTAYVTRSPTAAMAVGGTQAAGEAASTAREYIGNLSDEQLTEVSPYYNTLLRNGVSNEEARQIVTDKAAETGALLQGMVAALGSRVTGKLLTGAYDDILRRVGGNRVGATAAGAAFGAAEEGLQETAEGIASDVGIRSQITNKEIGEGSAANLVLGALGGAPVGAISGAKSTPESALDAYLKRAIDGSRVNPESVDRQVRAALDPNRDVALDPLDSARPADSELGDVAVQTPGTAVGVQQDRPEQTPATAQAQPVSLRASTQNTAENNAVETALADSEDALLAELDAQQAAQATAVEQPPEDSFTAAVASMKQDLGLDETETLNLGLVTTDTRLNRFKGALESAFGVKVHFVDFGEQLSTASGQQLGAFSGYRSGDTILVSAKDVDLLDTTWHELTHVLETRHADVYQTLRDTVVPAMDATIRQTLIDNLNQRRRAEVGRDMTQRELDSELVAYVVGDLVRNPQTLGQMFDSFENPEVAKTFRDVLADVLQKMLAVIKGPQYIKERARLVEAQKAVTTAFAEYQKRETQKRMAAPVQPAAPAAAQAAPTAAPMPPALAQKVAVAKAPKPRLRNPFLDQDPEAPPASQQAAPVAAAPTAAPVAQDAPAAPAAPATAPGQQSQTDTPPSTAAEPADEADAYKRVGGQFNRDIQKRGKLASDTFKQALDQDPQGMVDEYLRRFGREVNADHARELSPIYVENPAVYAAYVHEGASRLSKMVFDYVLTNAEQGDIVRFTAGGGGSGKGFAVKQLSLKSPNVILYDGTLSKLDTATSLINKSLASGLPTEVYYINSDAMDSLGRAMKRAERVGRTVPIEVLAEAHDGASNVARQLLTLFANVPLRVVNNGKNGVAYGSINDLPRYNVADLKEKMYAELNRRVKEDGYPINLAIGFAPDRYSGEAVEEQPAERDDRPVRAASRRGVAGAPAAVREQPEQPAAAPVAEPVTPSVAPETIPAATNTQQTASTARRAKKPVEPATPPKPPIDSAIAQSVGRSLGLTEEELRSTSLGYQTGKSGGDQFNTPRLGNLKETVLGIERARRFSGLRQLSIDNETDQDVIAKLIAAEALAAIRAGQNAQEWYDATIARLMGMAALKYPELADNRESQMAFRLAIAVSSQGLNVEDNLTFALPVYEYYRENGEFPERGSGESSAAMAKNFRLANDLMREMGKDMFMRFLETPFTAGELKSMGYSVDELVDENVLGSSVFGPKIGFGFYSNLSGNFEPVTIDMWFMRTIGRLTGKLRAFDAEKFAGQMARFRASFALTGNNGLFASTRKSDGNLMFDPELVAQAATDDESAIALARLVSRAHEKDFKDNREAFDSQTREKSEMVLAADTMIQSLDKPKDAPGNGTERRNLREIVRKAVALVEGAHGKRVPPAALQALIWYPEQELYKSFGVKLRVTSQDYAGAIRKILEKEGYSGTELSAAAESGSRGLQSLAAEPQQREDQAAGEADRRVRALEGTEREAFVERKQDEFVLKQERKKPRRKRVVFEVAPDPNNEQLVAAWRELSPERRAEISNKIARPLMKRIGDLFETRVRLSTQVGSYLDDTNPSFAMLVDSGDVVEIAKTAGFVLSQDSMIAFSPKPFKGGAETGAVTIDVGDINATQVDEIYQRLRQIRVGGEQVVGGQSTFNGQMVVLNYSNVDTETLASLINNQLQNDYVVRTAEVYTAFPEKQEYDYASPENDPRGKAKDLRERGRALRAEASALLAAELGIEDAGDVRAEPESVGQFSRRDVELAANQDPRAPKLFGISENPSVLRAVGAPDQLLVIEPRTVVKVVNPEFVGKATGADAVRRTATGLVVPAAPRIALTVDELRAVPQMIADPVAVIRSDGGTMTRRYGYKVVLDMVKDGNPVVAIVHPDVRYGNDKASEIASVYPVNEPNSLTEINRELNSGSLLYFNKGKAVALSGKIKGGLPSLAKVTPTTAKNPGSVPNRAFTPLRNSNFARNVGGAGFRFVLPDRTAREYLDNALANRMSRVEAVQQAVLEQGGTQDLIDAQGNVIGDTNITRATEAMSNAAAARLESFRDRTVLPLIEEAAQAGVNLDEVAQYLYAKYAPERNAIIQQRNPTQFATDGGSGMTNAEAARIVSGFRARPDFQAFEQIARKFQNITRMTQNILLTEGLVEPQVIAQWKADNPNYVPLRGFEDVDDQTGKPLDSTAMPGRRDPRNPFVKVAKGRESKAADILENIIKDYEDAIVLAEKNKVYRKLLQFVRSNPDPKLWEVNAPQVKRTYSKGTLSLTGMTQGQVSVSFDVADNPSETIAVRVKGKPVFIKINDPGMLDDLKLQAQVFDTKVAEIANQMLQTTMGTLKKTYTALNPVFVAKELYRSTEQMLLWNLTKFGPKDGATRAFRKLMKAAKTAYKAERDGKWAGNTDTITVREPGQPPRTISVKDAYEMFKSDGGKTAFLDIRNVDDIRDEISRRFSLAQAASTGDPRMYHKRMLNAVLSAEEAIIEFVSVSDNMFRFATYMARLEAGDTRQQAADAARNVTVNHAARGKLTPQLGLAYMFFNPGVQGARNTYRAAFKTGWRGKAAVASMIALGVLVAEMAVRNIGDDDEPYWDKDLYKQVKLRNIPIFNEDGDLAMIPLLYGWGFFVNVGMALSDLSRGAPLAKASSFLRDSFLTHFSPLGSMENLGTFLAPTLADPFLIVGYNETDQGIPLMPDYAWDPNKPDSEKYWNATRGTMFQQIARALNEMSGGTPNYAGAIDISPETMRYLFGFFLGGTGGFVRDTSESIYLSSEIGFDVAMEKNKIPLLKSFFQQNTGKQNQIAFNENSKAAIAALDDWEAHYGTEYEYRDDVSERLSENEALAALGSSAQSVKRALSALRQQEVEIIERRTSGELSASEAEELLRGIAEQKNDMYVEFNREFYAASPRRMQGR